MQADAAGLEFTQSEYEEAVWVGSGGSGGGGAEERAGVPQVCVRACIFILSCFFFASFFLRLLNGLEHRTVYDWTCEVRTAFQCVC